jgi:hypothetical protein
VPGNYTVGFNNAANSQGINFSNVRLTVDAIRVHKGESSSAMPLFWGANGRGESGVWDSGTSANWHDGTAPAIWHDLGAEDYVAVFAGKGGTIEVPRAIRANCIVFNATGYTLRGESLQLTGGKPTLHIANGAKATISLTIRQPDGTPLPAGNYTAATHPQLITGGGVLAIESPR